MYTPFTPNPDGENQENNKKVDLDKKMEQSAPSSEPQPTPPPATMSQTPPIQSVSTYESSVQDAIKNQDLSQAKIMMAEQQRRQVEKENYETQSIHTKKNKMYIFLAIVLVIAAIVVVWFFFSNRGFFIKRNAGPTVELYTPEFVEIDEQVEIPVGGRSDSTIFGEIQDAVRSSLEEDNIRAIVLTKIARVPAIDEEGTVPRQVAISTEEFFSILNARAPDYMVRALGENFVLGAYATTYNDTFLLFKVTDFENAFAGMLEWESQMSRDLDGIFPILTEKAPETSPPVTVATSTATSTTEVATSTATSTEVVATSTETQSTTSIIIFPNGEDEVSTSTEATSTPENNLPPPPQFDSFNPRLFEDLVVSNRDIRTIRRVSGELVFFYTFIDEETLLIATHPDTISEIITRLRAVQLTR